MRLRALTMAATMLALAACDRAPVAADANAAEAEAIANLAVPPADLAPGAAATERTTAANGRQYVELAGGTVLYAAEASRIALERSQSAGVRALAEAILANHGPAVAQLRTAAGQAQPPIAFAPQLSPAQRASLARLRGASGEAFDQLWIGQQVEAHEQAMTLATDFAANGDVPSLRSHAATAAGPIMVQLSQARTLAEGAVEPAADNAAAPPAE